jgi:hypothetical protein
MARDDRQKASDVFANTNFVFASKKGFSEAFPTIEEARIEVEEMSSLEPQTHYRTSKDEGLGEFINCSNSLCYKGGVSVGEVLRHMVKENLTEYESKMKNCQGHEGSPKGKKYNRRCLHRFKVKAWIKYKTPPTQAEGDQADRNRD